MKGRGPAPSPEGGASRQDAEGTPSPFPISGRGLAQGGVPPGQPLGGAGVAQAWRRACVGSSSLRHTELFSASSFYGTGSVRCAGDGSKWG